MSWDTTFHDNKGRRIKLPEKTTLDELLRLGFTDYHLAKPHEPLPDTAGCPGERTASGPSDETACSPLRVAYSREEMEAKLREWMVKEFGHPRDYITDSDQRNAWYRDNGLLYHFICDHFPSENKEQEKKSRRNKR